MIGWSEKPENPGLCNTPKLNSQGFTEVTRIHGGHKDSQRSQGFTENTRIHGGHKDSQRSQGFEVSGAGGRV